MSESLWQLLSGVLEDFGFERGDPLTPPEQRELLDRVVKEVEAAQEKKENRDRETIRMIRSVVFDYTASKQYELGLMTIRELLKGRR